MSHFFRCCALLILALGRIALAQEDGGVVADAAAEDAAVADAVAGDVVNVDAATADAATPDAGGCGELTYQGRCEADLVLYCVDDVVQQIDCGSGGGTCGLWDCGGPDCYGHGCVARAGQPCSPAVPCDITSDQGCLEGVCAASSPCLATSHVPECRAQTVISTCFAYAYDPSTGVHPEGVVWDYDCSEAGTEPYSCGLRSDGDDWCLGLHGANCSPAQGYECVSGLECVGSICIGEGDDAGLPPIDAGVGQPDARVYQLDGGGPGDSEGGACGCLAAPTGGVALALVLLLLGVLRSSWRRAGAADV